MADTSLHPGCSLHGLPPGRGAIRGLSICSQDNATRMAALLSWLPWEEPLNPHKTIIEVAAVLSPSTQNGIPHHQQSPFDFKLHTCMVGCERDQPFSTLHMKLTSLRRQTVKEVDSVFYIKRFHFANFYESLIHVVDQYCPMEIYGELQMQTTYVISKF